jgi:hypothetical protein
MKVSNFRDYERTGDSILNWRFTATIDVTTGYLWWKKTEPKKIAKKVLSNWFFMDGTGFTPGVDVELMEKPIAFERGWL